MRAMVVLVLLCLAGCEDGPLTKAYAEYDGCLSKRPAAECDNQRAKFEAARSYADASSRRINASGNAIAPVVYTAPQYGSQRGLTCIQNGGVTNCY